MSEIMMSGVLPRLILDGHKTQTRRSGKRWERVKVGDVLHVREAFCARYCSPSEEMPLGCAYRADYDRVELDGLVPEPKWTPAVHMPLELCRCRIRVTGIRHEVLGDISEADAVAEGMEQLTILDLPYSRRKIRDAIGAKNWAQAMMWFHAPPGKGATARDRFLVLARLMMGEEALSQECTVIEFEVVR